jgi:uroporphyrinogen III methyltransferase/synthase
MAIARLEEIVATLLARGKDGSTPAAAVRWGTTGEQRTIEAPLGELPAAVARAGLAAPALVVVGGVVSLRRELAWFERRPLFGRRVLVTRPRGQSAEMVRHLEGLGASVLLLPAVEIREIGDWGPVDRAIAGIAGYGWIVFTSVNGVRAFLGRLRHVGRDLRALGGARLAAIGPATAEALREFHLEPDVVPTRFRSEGLVEALKERVRGQRVLLARADRGRELLRDELSAVAEVEQVAVYSQVDAPELDPAVLADLRDGRIDFVTLTSSNIARSLACVLNPESRERIRSGGVRLITISPVTSAAVNEAGLPVAAEAREETVEGVIEALLELAAGEKKG